MTSPVNAGVLVIEDEIKIAQLIRDYLVHENYQVEILHDGTNAIATVESMQPALVILDIMLPGGNGLSICRKIRQISSVPVIMLTARVDEQDRLDGFTAGADDYVCKPFSLPELVARVSSVLRRTQPGSIQPPAVTDQAGRQDMVIDHENQRCSILGQPVSLTRIEFRILRELLSKPGMPFSRYQLMRAIYDDHRVVSDRTIDSHVSHLRKKLNDKIDGRELIKSEYGVGYSIE